MLFRSDPAGRRAAGRSVHLSEQGDGRRSVTCGQRRILRLHRAAQRPVSRRRRDRLWGRLAVRRRNDSRRAVAGPQASPPPRLPHPGLVISRSEPSAIPLTMAVARASRCAASEPIAAGMETADGARRVTRGRGGLAYGCDRAVASARPDRHPGGRSRRVSPAAPRRDTGRGAGRRRARRGAGRSEAGVRSASRLPIRGVTRARTFTPVLFHRESELTSGRPRVPSSPNLGARGSGKRVGPSVDA